MPAAMSPLPLHSHLPLQLLTRYLFFLTRRPISRSNLHYLEARLAGLRSLRGALGGNAAPGPLAEVMRQLDRLHPAGFARVGRSLQLALLPLAEGARALPGDVVVEDAPPPRGWPAEHRRALLVFGPGIGIGDEIILAPLPRWLKRANPALEITTLSGYEAIWDRVRHVDRRLSYRDHSEVLSALRGEPPHQGYDLVVFADFEVPELYGGVAADRRLQRYLELSLSGRAACLLDNGRRWIHRVQHYPPYAENYYYCLTRVASLLGLSPSESDRFSGVVDCHPRRPTDRTAVFVSPFTSKYDPSETYWSHLLASMIDAAGGARLRLLIDPGKNHSTAGFAAALARSLSARLGSSSIVELAGSPEERLPLAGVFSLLDQVHAVVCADSFVSHAAPLFGATAFVVARAGVANWWAPWRSSFYFDGEAPARASGATMGWLLTELSPARAATTRLARFTEAETRMVPIAVELEALFDGDPAADPSRLHALYQALVQLRDAVEANPGCGAATALADGVPGPPECRPRLAQLLEQGPALFGHLRHELESWRNTNYFKFLRSALEADELALGERVA